MTFRFVISEDVTLLFHVAGAAPPEPPQPAPVTVYDNFSPMLPAIRGSVIYDFEEVE